MNKETKLISAGRNPSKQCGAVNPPIYQTSTVIFPTLEEYHKASVGYPAYDENKKSNRQDFSYGIMGTPTTFAFQEALAELEGGSSCIITSSGLSAITTSLMSFLECGDNLLMVDTVYGPTRRFCNTELKKFGIEITYYDPLIGGEIEKLIKDNTKLIFLESPGSLTFEVQDIPAITEVAKKHGVITAIDNSWATPLFFKPFEHGVDISIQAITKYIGGHSDVILGAIITNDQNHTDKVIRFCRNIGVSSSPQDCYLAMRGLRSMAARLKMQQESTNKIIEWIEKQQKVTQILYPAYKGDAGYDLWKKLYTGAASLFSVVLDKKYSRDELSNMIDNFELFGIGCSWGGYESLVLDFDPSTIRTATTWQEKNTCIRFYIGLEEPSDMIADLEKGFARL